MKSILEKKKKFKKKIFEAKLQIFYQRFLILYYNKFQAIETSLD